MARKPAGGQSSQTEARASTPKEDATAAAAASASRDEQMAGQIAELRSLVESLTQDVHAAQQRAAQSDEFKATLADIKDAARTLLVTPAAAPVVAVAPPATAKNECGDCDGCGCVDASCCCFEIVLDKVRAIQPQLEPADMGDVTVPVPTMNELEVRIFASIDNIGILIPSLSTSMNLRIPSFLTGGGPGPWLPICQVINTICLKKGTTRTVTVDFQASELDEGLERAVGWKDEHGMASGTITLDCCTSKIYPPTPTDLSFEFGGTGGGIPGAISLAFFARRVCC